ncbi:hypothetical protein [Bradyrhizobium yuanmingense]|uniref:hypothetical protein n=1 Tax=Bradyrhizobium yuanmingense TaxID=108015 RepID=UPI0023B8A490|nr:hypothetical protein [Bradyrhizobium yuanmingense]MDF0584789.1 hypothetical protein [Bradyrhizobium yuanmingense]
MIHLYGADWHSAETDATVHDWYPSLSDERPLRRAARFTLIDLYNGADAGAITTASPFRAKGDHWLTSEADFDPFGYDQAGKQQTSADRAFAPLRSKSRAVWT